MEPLELICVAVWSFAVAVAGGLAGLVLGNLRLPVVLQFSTSPAGSTGACSLPAASEPSRGAYFGAHLTGRLDDQALLHAIAVILVVAGLALGAQAIVA